MFLWSVNFVKKTFFETLFQKHLMSVKQFGSRVESLFFVGPDLGPNRLQRRSADTRCSSGYLCN